MPFYVFDGQRTFSGAQPVEAFLRAIDGYQVSGAGWEASRVARNGA